MDIEFNYNRIASMNPSTAEKLAAESHYDVVSLSIPFNFRVEPADRDHRWLLTGIVLDLYGEPEGSTPQFLGRGEFTESITPANTALEVSRAVEVRCSANGLAQYELQRDGGPVKFLCKIRWKARGLTSVNDKEFIWFFQGTEFGSLQIAFSKEVWNRALRSCGLSASFVVEIPIPVLQGKEAGGAESALLDAFEAFEQGGTTAWKNCIGHIRPYLEKWRKSEPTGKEDPGDYGSASDRNLKLLTLRDALWKCCCLWDHESRTACSRKDAVLVLNSFAALIEAKKS